MDSLINLQLDNKRNIEKGRINYKKSPKERITLSYLETRLEALEQLWSNFIKTHRNIVEKLDLKHNYFTSETYDNTEDIYITYKSELKESIKQLTPTKAIVEKESSSNTYTNVKLPKVVIPTFSGKYTEWNSFRDLFLSLIHKNDSIDDVQKLHYLKGHLSGEPEQLLRHTPVTAANYQECWQMLDKRYNNKRYLSNSMLKRLITQSNVTESSTAVKELLDTTVDCLHGLSTLGIDVKSWDAIVIYIISNKLDSESRKLWELKISADEQLPTFEEFKIFLESRFRSLEYLDTSKPKQKSTDSKPKVFHAVKSNSNNSVQIICPFCKQDHYISNCKQFSKEGYQTRSDFVRTHNLCYNCLGANHSIKYCRAKTSCHICKRRHHSLLHPKASSRSSSPNSHPVEAVAVKSAVSTLQTASGTAKESESSTIATHFSTKVVPNRVLLATALVEAQTQNGRKQLLRALLDQGSQASFITESAVQLLGLKKIPNNSTVSGIGGDEGALASRFMVCVTIHSRHDPNVIIQVRAYVLSKITTLLPSTKLCIPTWPQLEDITLADPEYHTPNKIDVLFGAEVYSQVLKEGLVKHSPGPIIAQNTTLGWILSGLTATDCDLNSANCHKVIVSMHSHLSDNDMLKKFWEIESDVNNKKKILTQEEQLCEEFFTRTTQRDATGRYVVKLPFRESDPRSKIGYTKEIALKRFHHLEQRFKKNHETKRKYTEVIQEYLDLGHMKIVCPETDTKQSEAVYLPHHAVVREDKTSTKVRVVFDASSKGSNGGSLNDMLMVGPTIQPELRHIIMRWRTYPIVLCADIVKMYRQIKVAPEDTHFQRLLWRSDPKSEIKEYELLRVTFGTASAPYLAVKSLQQLAHDEGAEFPLVSETLKSEFYVDDYMSGCQTVEDGKRIHRELEKLLEKGGFPLQKWMTNNKELAEEILGEGANQEGIVEMKLNEVVKILGLSWDRESDSFRYSINFPQPASVTKRKVISDISRLFDPLGWVAPCVIPAKIMIQKIWLAGIDWDDRLPEDLLKEWQTYQKELLNLPEFHVPRWVESREDDVVVELHGFCDASNVAYAAVIYLRIIGADGNIKINLISAKTKVAPIKQLSIPRLELMGAVLLAKLIVEVAEILVIPKDRIHCWTDSTVVLAWLSNHPSRWTTFVGNRVSEILSFLDNPQWGHVKSTHNPADIASRGMTPSALSQSSLWKHGPLWLKKEPIDYVKPNSISTKLEERSSKGVKAHVTTNVENWLWTKYSSLQKLIRVVAYCRRFLKFKQHKETYLTSEELTAALEICIKKCQEQEFKEDIENIKKTGSVSKKSKLRPLCPILDEQGILRVGGRIEKSQLSVSMRHPIIIPQRHHFATLLVSEAHKTTLHGGPTLMLNYLRTRYWILSAKNVVKAYVRTCVVCVRHSATFKNQLMGQLPTCRVSPARPFLHTGVDFAGPINIRVSKGRGNKAYKGYICLFVCMVTRAVHIEAISDLTSESFIAGFKRFVARRGHCSDIWSDNGKNFVGAAKELQILVAAEQSAVANEIRSWLSCKGVKWHFIPPHAPNFGGLWEAGIKSTKFHMKRVIGDSTLTYEEMATLLVQIEACLNSRPVSHITQTPDDPLPLTPGHFLIGEPLILVPERNYERSSVGTLRRWQLLQKMTQDFWRRWSREFLTSMLQRYKWSQREIEPNIGDIVLVKEDNLPPGKWLLGRILEKHPGSDGLTRVVTIKCNGSVFKRPICKLCVLPTSD